MTTYDSHRRVVVRWSILSDSAKSRAYKLKPFVKYHTDGEDFTIVPQWFVSNFNATPIDLSSISDKHIRTLRLALEI